MYCGSFYKIGQIVIFCIPNCSSSAQREVIEKRCFMFHLKKILENKITGFQNNLFNILNLSVVYLLHLWKRVVKSDYVSIKSI